MHEEVQIDDSALNEYTELMEKQGQLVDTLLEEIATYEEAIAERRAVLERFGHLHKKSPGRPKKSDKSNNNKPTEHEEVLHV